VAASMAFSYGFLQSCCAGKSQICRVWRKELGKNSRSQLWSHWRLDETVGRQGMSIHRPMTVSSEPAEERARNRPAVRAHCCLAIAQCAHCANLCASRKAIQFGRPKLWLWRGHSKGSAQAERPQPSALSSEQSQRAASFAAAAANGAARARPGELAERARTVAP